MTQPRDKPSPQDWAAIMQAVDDDCAMSIVADLAQKECTWEQAATRICAYAEAAWRQALVARSHVAPAALKPEQITEAGWYYRVDDDEYVRVETYRYPIMKPGLLPRVSGALNECDVERWETGLTLQGMAYPPDWGKAFIGPLSRPSATATTLPDWRMAEIRGFTTGWIERLEAEIRIEEYAPRRYEFENRRDVLRDLLRCITRTTDGGAKE